MIAEIALALELVCAQACPAFEHLKYFAEQPQVKHEIQWVAKNALESASELGGQVCVDDYGLRFKQLRNVSGNFAVNPLTANKGDVNAVMELVTKYFASNECSPYNQSFYWKESINNILRKLDDVNSSPDNKEVLEDAITSYNALLNSTYHQEEAENCKMHVGNFHTHDNGSNSSNTDLCINRNSQRNDFLISVDKQAPGMFKLYFLQDGIEALVGTYQIENM